MNSHILIVDDEAAIRDMVRMALEMEGFTVSDASNAHQAAKLLETEDVDLILLDWMMPGVSGVDFAGKIRRRQYVCWYHHGHSQGRGGRYDQRTRCGCG